MDASHTNPRNWREWRRLQAVRLKQQGWHQRDIAPALGVREETVSRWLARARQGGPETLRARSAPGRPPKLTSDQKRMIPEFMGRIQLPPSRTNGSPYIWTLDVIAEDSLV